MAHIEKLRANKQQKLNIQVIHFKNEEIKTNTANVLKRIEETIMYRFKKFPPGDLGVNVSWQSWRAATRNPVEALRYE